MRFIGFVAAIIVLGVNTTQVSAEMSDKERNQFLRDMANVIAAESFCNVKYDMQAVSDYIAKKIPADDLAFGNDIRREAYNTKMALAESLKEGSARTIYCTAQIRAAHHLGFVKNAPDGHVPSSF